MRDWREGKLSDIALVTMGQSPQGETCNVTGEGIPLLNGPTEFGIQFPTPLQYTVDPKKICETGDILFCVRGSTTGRMNWANQSFAIGRGLASVRHIKGKVYQHFLKGVLDFYLPILLQSATGSTFPNVSCTELNQLEISIPNDKEQITIAEFLSSLDDKLYLLHRQNKTLEQLAETLFRQWFVEEAEEGWEEKSLDEIAEFLNGLACQKFPQKQNEIGLPVIKIKEMRTGITDASDYATGEVPAKYIIENGDMLFSWSGSLEVVLWFGGKGILNQHLFKVSSKIYPQWFYYFWTQYHLQEFRGVAVDKATTMGHIQRHHLSDAKVSVPSRVELQRMNGTMDPIFQKIKSNTQQIHTLTQLRDTLLPKLMSGEVRVKTCDQGEEYS